MKLKKKICKYFFIFFTPLVSFPDTGDLNGDQIITLDDIEILSSGLLSEINLTLFQYWASDLDFSNNVSVFDLISLSDIVR